MKVNKFFFAAIILFLAAAFLDALGSGDSESQTVQVTGWVRLVGSSPDYMLVITGENREWYVDEKEQKKLMQLQQQTVTVTGTEYFKDLTFANGMSTGRRYYLKNIKVLKTVL
jgi:cytochrome c oxidase assembly factor CtaG